MKTSDNEDGFVVPRYIRQHWSPRTQPIVKVGDYVVATKYADGDPGDQFCIGFYNGSFEHAGQIRHLVIDSDGKNFRHNGFRRVARVSKERGEWMVQHLADIETMKERWSVWHWWRAPWRELRAWTVKPRDDGEGIASATTSKDLS